MGSHADCKAWDYDDHPNRGRISERCDRLMALLRTRPRRFDRYGYDTRRGHVFMFSGMAPSQCECIVGRYRGFSRCSALVNYAVTIPADPRVGLAPYLVSWAVGELEKRCAKACGAFEAWRSAFGSKATPEAALVRFVSVLCEALDQFFLIHPYANGNGHTGRLLLWVLMTRHGYPPYSWPLDERPPYDAALTRYRAGDKTPLMTLILQSMAPPQP
jgi:hypothetical protein